MPIGRAYDKTKKKKKKKKKKEEEDCASRRNPSHHPHQPVTALVLSPNMSELSLVVFGIVHTYSAQQVPERGRGDGDHWLWHWHWQIAGVGARASRDQQSGIALVKVREALKREGGLVSSSGVIGQDRSIRCMIRQEDCAAPIW
ncbi:uncharacterized protein ColSpa_05464 [Colletotrichum spaethianum]|uniref:Uncharacterized protein n=1 Tax=Colletotrichum spaethianum TaxID=700344 RepID=A0AA37LBE2_9PEZI|nr:uncharacterized protein ColSpa_05464 [Colletotrichum spaethianum]GKT45283.1 hypothetical protein ColSpa_05464 [Colletotrichum spaethianum]